MGHFRGTPFVEFEITHSVELGANRVQRCGQIFHHICSNLIRSGTAAEFPQGFGCHTVSCFVSLGGAIFDRVSAKLGPEAPLDERES